LALEEVVEGNPPATVLLEEACRIADRLDKLDALLVGDADVWCRLVADLNSESTYELRVSSALVEARQQAAVLRQLVASVVALAPKESDDGDDDDWVADLAGVSTEVRDQADR
jgi:hypothetical protein